MMKKLIISILVFGVYGCGETTIASAPAPKLEDYDQTCTVNSDCEIVNIDPCGCGTCTTAVNVSDEAAVRAAAAKVDCTDVAVDGECEICETVPECIQGLCKGREPVVIRVEDYATNCETVADCKLIAPGEVYQPCACPAVPVNAADYDSKVGAPPECNFEGTTCNNCEMPDLSCVENVCLATYPET